MTSELTAAVLAELQKMLAEDGHAEWAKIVEAAQRADAAEKRVRELEFALLRIATCVTSPASPDYLGPEMAKQIARTALGKEPRT